MKLIFDYPATLDSLELMLTTKAYEDIWLQDGKHMVDLFHKYTALQFQQDEIHVRVHDGQSMSGKDGVPMRLNVHNKSLNEKRNALIHELGHRLLFGNGLYAPEGEGPDADEIRVFLFQGEVLKELYGQEVYDWWANPDSTTHSEDHARIISKVLVLTPEQRLAKFRQLVLAS
jgi:hypothetical protein